MIFPQIFPCSNYKICPIIPLLFPGSKEEDLVPEEEEVFELNLSISDDDLGGEEVEVEMAEQDGDLELPDPEACLNIEQERTVKKSNCVGQAKKQKRALSVRKRTPSKRVRKVPPKLLD